MGKVVIVNKKDQVLGEESRNVAHQVNGLLHRGFIVLIFNQKRELLLVKRSKKKMLWSLFWDGCCSHPRLGEGYIKAGERRLKEELGFSCQLKHIDKFYYRAVYQDVGSEEEICAVLEGKYNGQIKPDSEEVADYRWIDLEELEKEIKTRPEIFVPWLKLIIRKPVKEDDEKN